MLFGQYHAKNPEREAFNLKWNDIPNSMQFFMAKKIELHSLVSKTLGFKDKYAFWSVSVQEIAPFLAWTL